MPNRPVQCDVADPEANNLLKVRAGIKRSGKDTAENANIITAGRPGLQENALARPSNLETIQRDVRRNRSNIIIQQYLILMIHNLSYHRIIL